ncbi:MAG: ATP-binding protein, partial [Brevundimonas sp.]|nr:ATP-binding protein [Brevundimonas sp.]
MPYNPAEISQAHLEGLIAAGTVEGVGLEFKAEAYAPDHEGVKEFLKDVTSFANTAGGLLLIGMRESDGAASALNPISLMEVDKLKLRLESLLQDGVV